MKNQKMRARLLNNMPTKTVKAPARPSEIVSFYGGQVQIEKKPWGDHYRFFKIVGSEKLSGLLSATSITKHLDKSKALLPWAVDLVGSHIRTTINFIGICIVPIYINVTRLPYFK